MKASELKNLVKEYEAAKAYTTSMYTASDEEFDAALDAECDAQDALAKALVSFTDEQITEAEANKLVCMYYDRLAGLIEMLAA